MKRILLVSALLGALSVSGLALQAPPPAPTPSAPPQAPAAPGAPPAAGAPSLVALKATRVFDGRSDRYTENGIVLIEGSKIRDVGAGITIPSGATVLDLGDATILAGVHRLPHALTGESSDNWLGDFYEGLRRPATEQAFFAAAVRAARRSSPASRPSATSARATGSTSACATPSTAGSCRGRACSSPARRSARRAATATDGGFPPGDVRGRAGADRRGSSSGAGRGPAAVRLNVKYGADVIKTCASGGVLSLNDDVVVAAADRRGARGARGRGAPARDEDGGPLPRRRGGEGRGPRPGSTRSSTARS